MSVGIAVGLAVGVGEGVGVAVGVGVGVAYTKDFPSGLLECLCPHAGRVNM